MAKYKVKHTSILHSGNLYKEGSIIELDEKYAAKLADFIERIPNQAKSKAETQTKTQTSKSTAKPKTQTKTETSETSKDGNADGKDGEKDGGVNNDK